ENPLHAGGGRAGGARRQGRRPVAFRQGPGRHAAGKFHRPHQKRGGIPGGCGRIALPEGPDSPYLKPESGRSLPERHPAPPPKGPIFASMTETLVSPGTKGPAKRESVRLYK